MKDQALHLLQSGLTPAEVGHRLGIDPAKVRVWKSRANSNSWKKANPALIDEYHLHIPKPDTAKQPAENQQAQPTCAPPKTSRLYAPAKKQPVVNYRAVALDALLIAVIVGHAGLVWYDCWTQWSTPGAIGGGVTFLIVLAALLLASDETKNRTSETALYFVLVVDVAAWWVHYPTFQRYAGIGSVETGAFAAFLCACSWAALYLYRDSKLQ